MKYVTKAKNTDTAEVRAPLLPASFKCEDVENYAWALLNPSEAQNITVANKDATSILSCLDDAKREYSDISGCIVTMVTRIHDNIFQDEVEVVAENSTSYIVRVLATDDHIAVYKGVVRFIAH